MLSFPWRAIRGLYRILLAIPSRLTPWCIALPHEFLEGSRTHSHGQFRQCSLSFLWIWTSSNGGLCPLPHFPTCVCQSEVTSSPTMCLQGALQHHQFSSFAGQRFAELKVGLSEDNIQMQGSTPNTGPGSLQGRAAHGFSSVRRPCVSTTGSPRSSMPASWEHGLLLFYFDLNSPALFKTARDADHPTLKSPSFAPLLYSSGSPPIPLWSLRQLPFFPFLQLSIDALFNFFDKIP